MKKNSLSIAKHRFQHALVLMLLSIIVLLTQACKRELPFSYQVQDRKLLMFDQLKTDTSLSILVQALERTNLSYVLNSYGPYTLFAADNNGFRNYFKIKGKSGLADFPDSILINILRYSIMPARLKAADFIQGPQVTPSSSGDNINLDISKGYKGTAIANATALVYQTDIEYYNGIVHKMDAVLDPPTITIGEFLKSNPDKYSILTSGLQRAGLMDTLSSLTNSFGTRIKLTLFTETNDVLKAAGINDYNNLSQDSLVTLMRNHIVASIGVRSSYTRATTAIPALNVIGRYDSTLSTLDGQDWIYFDLAAKNLIDSTNDFTASDLAMRNGLVHSVAKPLVFTGPTKKRTQIYCDIWLNQVYCYGLSGFANGASPVPNASAGNFRYYNDNTTVDGYKVNNLTFMNPGKAGDSMVIVVKGVKRGKYRIEVNGKSGGRGTYQLNYRTDSITTYNFSFAGLPTYHQKYVLGTYDFKTSGDKRLNFIAVASNINGINLECLVLTPVN